MTLKRILTTSVVAFVIAGCGGGGGNTPTQNTGDNGGTPPPTTQNKKLTSGTVSDGYIAGANVLVDINTTTKGAFDSGDYNTTTNVNGNFDIPETLTVANGTIIYANGGKIISTGEDFNGTLKGVFDGQKDSIVLSPVTTMVAALVEDKNITSDQAKEKVATALNIPVDKVTADPVTDDDALKAVQKVVAIAKVIQTDSNDSVSEIIEDIAKELDDSNLTKAVQSATNDENLTKAAMETADVVEDAIDKLQQDTNSSNTEIEKAIQEHVVEKAKEAVENEDNVTEALNEGKEKLTNTDFQDTVEAASCLTFDKIKGNNSNANSVITDLNLTAKSSCEDNNVTIAWINASSNIDKTTGAVTRANYDDNLSFVEANVTKNAQSITKPIFFTVLAKGQRPVAMPDNATVEEDSNVTIDILANDTDDNKSELNVTIATDPVNGTATVTDNKIVYTPNANFNGTDILTYSLLDPYGAESNATVTITVTPKNDAPVLDDLPNLPSIPEDSNATTITLHATDADANDTITYSATSSNPAIATVNVSGDQLTVTPKPNANGDVNITVTATDSHGASDSKTVTLHITPVNDAPVLSDIQNVNVNEDASNLTINLQATDVDGDRLSYSAVSSDESMVSVSVNANVLTLTFVPNANGQATITVTVSDGNGGTAEKTFTVNITPVNDAPVLNNIPNNPTIDEDDQPFHIELNATDADHDNNLEFSATSSDTSIVQVSVNDNILTITPQLNANGDVNITVTVIDHNGGSDSKTVTLHINPKNDAPVAVDDAVSVASNAIALIDVLANDSDIDSPTLTITSVEQPANGNVSIVNNKIQFTPPADFNGTVTFGYTISDDQNATATATVTVDVAQYVTAMTNAINQVNNFDKENGDFDNLLSSVRSTLENADANETDAQVGLALVELIETINTDIANFIEIDGSQASIDMLLHKEDGAKAALAIVGSLSDQSEASLQNIAAKLKNIADKIDALLSSNPGYEFKYKDFSLSSDDLKALSGALDLKAAVLEYGAAYKPTKKEYVETKTADINGTSVEYQVYKVDPKTVLNDPETLSLNANAQNHFATSKSELQRAINKLASVDTSKVKNDFKSKLDNIQAKLTDLNNSLNGGDNFINGDEDKVYIDISALFNESTAPTLASTLGNNWDYENHRCDTDYNATLSKMMNKPMTMCTCDLTLSDGTKLTKPMKLSIKPNQIPTGESSHLLKIVKKIETEDGNFTGNDILDKMFGEIEALSSETTYQYDSLSDVNITYTIDYDSPTGNTPQSYSCEVIDVNLYNENWDSVDTGNNFLTVNIVNGNKCKLTFDTSVGINTGSISYEIVIKDSFGHNDHEYGWFAFGSQNNGGGDNGDQNGTNGGDQGGGADNNDNNQVNIGFSDSIDADTYNNVQASNVPDFPIYKLKYRKDDNEAKLKIAEIDRNSTHITYSKTINGEHQEGGGTARYSVDNNVISLQDDAGNVFKEIKFIKQLNSNDLNEMAEKEIFGDGDIGYVTYWHNMEEEYDDDEYEAIIWFNESAKNHFIEYIHENFGN